MIWVRQSEIKYINSNEYNENTKMTKSHTAPPTFSDLLMAAMICAIIFLSVLFLNWDGWKEILRDGVSFVPALPFLFFYIHVWKMLSVENKTIKWKVCTTTTFLSTAFLTSVGVAFPAGESPRRWANWASRSAFPFPKTIAAFAALFAIKIWKDNK